MTLVPAKPRATGLLVSRGAPNSWDESSAVFSSPSCLVVMVTLEALANSDARPEAEVDESSQGLWRSWERSDSGSPPPSAQTAKALGDRTVT